MIKNFIKYSMLTFTIIWVISSSCFWLRWLRWDWEGWGLDPNFPYETEGDPTENLECNGNTDLWNCTSVKEDVEWWWDETIIRRLLWVFGLDTSGDRDLKFIDYARAILNMALGLIAFIALIMTIYTFYMMLFSENEAWIKKAKWSLVGIFIALAIVWLAWLIVSFIFWWYQKNWKQREDDIETWKIVEQQGVAMMTNNTVYLTI